MERIFLSEEPTKPESTLAITPRASSDILGATKLLWSFIYVDPLGGTLERMGYEGMSRYASFADVPAPIVEKLGLVLRHLENHLVDDLLKAQDQSWYQDKIVKFARAYKQGNAKTTAAENFTAMMIAAQEILKIDLHADQKQKRLNKKVCANALGPL